jgi:hypothetical protein
VLLEEVGHADGFGLAGLFDCFQGCPGFLQVLRRLGIERCVDEVEIYIIQPKFLQRGFKSGLYVLLLGAGEFSTT